MAWDDDPTVGVDMVKNKRGGAPRYHCYACHVRAIVAPNTMKVLNDDADMCAKCGNFYCGDHGALTADICNECIKKSSSPV